VICRGDGSEPVMPHNYQTAGDFSMTGQGMPSTTFDLRAV